MNIYIFSKKCFIWQLTPKSKQVLGSAGGKSYAYIWWSLDFKPFLFKDHYCKDTRHLTQTHTDTGREAGRTTQWGGVITDTRHKTPDSWHKTPHTDTHRHTGREAGPEWKSVRVWVWESVRVREWLLSIDMKTKVVQYDESEWMRDCESERARERKSEIWFPAFVWRSDIFSLWMFFPC